MAKTLSEKQVPLQANLLIWSNKFTSPHFSHSFIYSLSFVPGTAQTNTISADAFALSFAVASVLPISYHVTPWHRHQLNPWPYPSCQTQPQILLTCQSRVLIWCQSLSRSLTPSFLGPWPRLCHGSWPCLCSHVSLCCQSRPHVSSTHEPATVTDLTLVSAEVLDLAPDVA